MEFSKERITKEELINAFKKLQSFAYFDNYDLLLREKIATYKIHLDDNFETFISELRKKNPFSKLFADSVSANFLPKKVECNPSGLPANYYTNAKIIEHNEIKKPVVFCNLPIEFHLISVVWLMRYGSIIEAKISKKSLGNRLIISEKEKNVIQGRSLFKPYIRQFQNWWSGAIKETKSLLEKGEDVTIINFDLQSFYNDVRFDFQKLELSFTSLSDDIAHVLLKKIHNVYASKVFSKHYRVQDKVAISSDLVPLPIGLLSSHVLANWYLSKLDKFIDKHLRPVYYGRYVDDVLIVIKNTVLEKDEIFGSLPNSDNDTDKEKLINYYINEYLNGVFEIDNGLNIRIKLKEYSNLKLNKSKLFVYQFDAKHSPNLVEKFVDEQKEKSSMFRFLSDEDDELFDDFEKITFESNFDQIDANKARFKNIEDNKYRLSTFFSKLIKRRIVRGKGYKEGEVEKILKYFKGIYLIKNYYFWEKLFTLLIVYDRRESFSKLVEEINHEIQAIIVKHDESESFQVEKLEYQKTLRKYLKLSVSMAVGLKPSFLSQDKILIRTIAENIEEAFIPKFNAKRFTSTLIEAYRLFRDSGLLRSNFIYYSLFQYTKLAKNTEADLTSVNSIVLKENDYVNSGLEIAEDEMQFIPVRIKFWQVALWNYYKLLTTEIPSATPNARLWFNDRYFSGTLLDKSFDDFAIINSLLDPSKTKDQYFITGYSDKTAGSKFEDSEKRIPKERKNNYFLQEIYLMNGGQPREKIRIGIVNKYVDFKDFNQSLKGEPKVDLKKQEIFEQVLDDVSKIENCDLFVMPELCLPHRLINLYTQESVRKQVGLVTGVEHINVHNTGLNFILTVLPININGEKDGIPVLRLKNHYAPDEEELLDKYHITIPKPNPYRYDLFIWRGFYFAPYYCFELADVFHRSAFFSKVDAIIAPVWNQDTHYYNSLIDSATRDMHNYFILVNTSQYGYSKISRPRDHVHKEKLIVKGGTEEGYPYTLLIGDIRIKELREFQLLNFNGQKELNKDKKSFKPTPPDFILADVKMRIKGKGFFSKGKRNM
jgi:hypothetical protein